MENNQKAQLTEGPVGPLLIRKSIPMVFGITGMIAFNLVDTFFVGQLGTNQLAAISFTFPIVYFISGIAMGLGNGAAAVVSKAIGTGDREKVVRLSTDALILATIIVTVFVLIGIFSFETLFVTLGAGPEILPFVKQYMYYWYPGMIFLVVPMVGNSILRATGDTKTPSMIMMLAVVINLILDPILIFGWWIFPRLEVEGAAIATVIARAVTFVISTLVLIHREKLISLKVPSFAAVWESWKKILYIGLPSAGTSIIIPLAIGILTGIVAVHGPEAVAGFGVATRIEALGLSVIMALASILGPFIGQNLGAGKIDRLKLGMKLSNGFSIIWGLFLTLILFIIAGWVSPLFNDNPVVQEIVEMYLYIVPVAYGLGGIVMLSGVAFNILNKPFHSAGLALLRMFVLLVPLALLGSALYGLKGIFIAAAVSGVIGGIVAWFWLRSHLSKLERTSS